MIYINVSANLYVAQVVVGQLIEKNWKDEDIKEDVEHVKGVLDEMLQDMSTFDSYLAEVGLGTSFCVTLVKTNT